MMEYRRRFEVRPESVGNLSNSMTEDRRQIETLPQPVFNSTPVSSSKRKIFAYYDESLKLKGEDDEYNNDDDENADGSRYTFNESSFSSLELSRETSGAGISASESRLSTNITGKNLLQLFNTAGSSSEEEN
ncbi:hypothetical protein Avbf_14706 [Armadillidium vulgare]|nr:hypothetical protein Avbf_14706 [Armadillidium vulgare]